MTNETSPLDSRTARGAVAAGLASIAADGTVLDTWFPAPALTDGSDAAGTGTTGTVQLSAAEAVAALGEGAAAALRTDARR